MNTIKFVLTAAILTATNAAQAIPKHIPGNSPHDPEAVSLTEAIALVEKQFEDFFTDCDAFVDSFHPQFKYCDAGPCIKKKNQLLEICESTSGFENTIHSLRVLPASDTENPNYSQVTAVGQQTVDLTQIGLFPLCFDFAIRENLIKTINGVKSTYWFGYYSISFPGQPGSACPAISSPSR